MPQPVYLPLPFGFVDHDCSARCACVVFARTSVDGLVHKALRNDLKLRVSNPRARARRHEILDTLDPLVLIYIYKGIKGIGSVRLRAREIPFVDLRLIIWVILFVPPVGSVLLDRPLP